MKFFSTNQKTPTVSFREGVIKSLPEDNGLYFPEQIPDLSAFHQSGDRTLQEIAYQTLAPFVIPDIPATELQKIVEDTFSFEIPVVQVEENIHSLELFHGPTYAFKDVGARFLARCLGYFNQTNQKEVTILVATSGDTGGAVASGFYQVPGVQVVILYPSEKVSDLQEKQLTTLGHNITALEVSGTFDDCQHLVKTAFLDKELNQHINLSSANSINIARWIPQSIYYGWAQAQLRNNDTVFSIPSGNYGNLAAGVLAKKMGVPVGRFIAASNANDVVPRYLKSGQYEPAATIPTYSNAMDVGAPSNFPRMLQLYGNDYSNLKEDIDGYSLNDEDTLKTMSACWKSNDYILDPHGAIGYSALKEMRAQREVGIFLETAHPCKFSDVVGKVIPDYEIPDFTGELMLKEKKSTKMTHDFGRFKEYLLK